MLKRYISNKWLELLASLAIFLVLLVVFAMAFTGNWFFDRIYLWQPNLQAILTLAGFTAFPYYVRYAINTIRR